MPVFVYSVIRKDLFYFCIIVLMIRKRYCSTTLYLVYLLTEEGIHHYHRSIKLVKSFSLALAIENIILEILSVFLTFRKKKQSKHKWSTYSITNLANLLALILRILTTLVLTRLIQEDRSWISSRHYHNTFF